MAGRVSDVPGVVLLKIPNRSCCEVAAKGGGRATALAGGELDHSPTGEPLIGNAFWHHVMSCGIVVLR